jgi:hypothetical protein
MQLQGRALELRRARRRRAYQRRKAEIWVVPVTVTAVHVALLQRRGLFPPGREVVSRDEVSEAIARLLDAEAGEG